MTIYRRIYEQHHGTIPVDETGRTYDIHHIDGNHANNDVNNLVALPIKEHYNVHYKQGDYAACLLLAGQIAISPQEKSYLCSLSNTKRIEQGIHHFLDKEAATERNIKRVKNGTHQFVDSSWQSKYSRKRVEDGTHNFLDENFIRNNADSKCKGWFITFPDGHSEYVKSLTKFCKDYELNNGLMCLVAQGKRKHHKGFVVKQKDIL